MSEAGNEREQIGHLSEQEKAIINNLNNEILLRNQEIQQSMQNLYRLFGLLSVVASATFGFGIYKKVAIAFPITIFLIVYGLFHSINLMESVMASGGYKAAVEEKLNKLLKIRVHNWEAICPRFVHNRISQLALMVIGLIFGLSVIVRCLSEMETSPLFRLVIVLFLVLAFFTMVGTLAQMWTLFDRVKNATLQFLEGHDGDCGERIEAK